MAFTNKMGRQTEIYCCLNGYCIHTIHVYLLDSAYLLDAIMHLLTWRGSEPNQIFDKTITQPTSKQ